MKTTVELPDLLFRKVKSAAAEDGMSLKDFFSEAVMDSLRKRGSTMQRGTERSRPWAKAFGGLKDLHSENKRIERLIAAEFESVEDEQWR